MTIRDSLAQVLRRLSRRIKGRACSHRFALEDLRMVNRDGDLDRVAWPCDACGKNFSAHCGLDISPKHGPTFQRKVPELMKMLDDRSAELTTAWMAGVERERDRATAEAWRPIESAPRDGTYILVCNSHGSWIAKWKPVFQSGFRPLNPWASMMLNHDHIERPGRFDHPTHWRPLPAPPAERLNSCEHDWETIPVGRRVKEPTTICTKCGVFKIVLDQAARAGERG